ncbi:MAG: amino acid permease [Bacteroidetes bacterium]|nr:amino acid permease [Bacteroidota bacterium]
MPADTTNKIKPQLKTFDLTMVVAGLVIGMGIFRAPAEVAQKAVTPMIFFLAWATGALVSFIGGITFAEIGSRYPAAGGFYKILSHCYHPCFAFMVNWVVILSNAGAMAAVAIMGAEYIAPVLLPHMQQQTAITGITVASIAVLYLLNMRGYKTSSKLLNGLMFVKLGMLTLLIAAVFIVKGPVNEHVVHEQSAGDMFSAFLMCFIPVFFTYGGYQQTMNFGKDVADARKTMPRAIFYGITIILLVYLSVNYSFYKVLGFGGLAKSSTIAADITGMMMGPVAYKFVAVTMFLSVMAYVNVGLMSNPRVYFAMVEDKVLPPIFKRINSKTQVQEFALTVFCAFIFVTLFFLSSFQKILEHVMFFDSIGFMTAAASIFILRAKKEGEGNDVYKIWGYPILPVIFILVYLGVNISVFYANPTAAISGFVLFVAGAPLYYLAKFAVARTKPEAEPI